MAVFFPQPKRYDIEALLSSRQESHSFLLSVGSVFVFHYGDPVRAEHWCSKKCWRKVIIPGNTIHHTRTHTHISCTNTGELSFVSLDLVRLRFGHEMWIDFLCRSALEFVIYFLPMLIRQQRRQEMAIDNDISAGNCWKLFGVWMPWLRSPRLLKCGTAFRSSWAIFYVVALTLYAEPTRGILWHGVAKLWRLLKSHHSVDTIQNVFFE